MTENTSTNRQATTPSGVSSCPACGYGATTATLLGRAARLFCYRAPCDRMWWAV